MKESEGDAAWGRRFVFGDGGAFCAAVVILRRRRWER